MNNHDKQIIHKQLSMSALIGELPERFFETLAAQAHLERYEAKTLLCQHGQPMTHIWLVVEGFIDLIAHAPSGRVSSLVHIGKGQWATWLGCFYDAPPKHDFYSSANAVLISVPCQTLRNIADHHPPLHHSVIRHIGERFRLLMEWTEQSSLLKHEYRMAKMLCVMARMSEVRGDAGYITATQDVLARSAGCSRQTTNQLLKKLADQQLLVLHYKRIEIPNISKLEDFAFQSL